MATNAELKATGRGLPRSVRWGDKLILPGLLGFTRWGVAWSRRRGGGPLEELQGKRVLITGASSGIGAATAHQVAALGASLVLVVRNEPKGQGVAQRIRESTGAEVQLEIADLSRMGDVDVLVRRLLLRGEPLDVLINNAGALYNARRETAEGVEMSFATLLLSPFVLTEALHPLLKAARGSRVINVSSGGMYTQRVHLDDLEFARGRFDGAKAYARAKRGLVDLAEVWARQWASEGIVVHSMHPGWADTPGVVESLPSFHRWTRPLLRTAEEAAEGLTWLAASAQVAESTGLFWLDCLPRTTAVFPGTRSSLGTQRKMVAALAGYAHRLLPGADYLSHTLQGVSSFSS